MSRYLPFEPGMGRITPWVGRLLAANAVILFLQQTLLTSPAITTALWFDPVDWITRPWTFFSYMFVHGSIMHLAANSLMLFVFGPPVERWLGRTRFIMYYLCCGVGAAIFSLLLSEVFSDYPIVGASGAVLGVALAFARCYPDATIILFPIPKPIKAKWMVAILATIDVLGATLTVNDGIAHIAHLGGMAFGAMYFMADRSLRNGGRGDRLPPMRPQTPMPAGRFVDPGEGAPATMRHRTITVAHSPPAPAPDPAQLEAEETDRILDKIGSQGMESLTQEERRFLNNVAARRRDQQSN
jgi:membrane associated rhomboid family serine protease